MFWIISSCWISLPDSNFDSYRPCFTSSFAPLSRVTNFCGIEGCTFSSPAPSRRVEAENQDDAMSPPPPLHPFHIISGCCVVPFPTTVQGWGRRNGRRPGPVRGSSRLPWGSSGGVPGWRGKTLYRPGSGSLKRKVNRMDAMGLSGSECRYR